MQFVLQILPLSLQTTQRVSQVGQLLRLLGSRLWGRHSSWTVLYLQWTLSRLSHRVEVAAVHLAVVVLTSPTATTVRVKIAFAGLAPRNCVVHVYRLVESRLVYFDGGRHEHLLLSHGSVHQIGRTEWSDIAHGSVRRIVS